MATHTTLSSRTGLPRPKRKAPLHEGRADLRVLAEALRSARLAQGLTQAALAALAGTGLRFIVELEQGKPTVRQGKCLDVVATLGLRLALSGPSAATGRGAS